MNCKRKHKSYSLEQKLKILKRLEAGETAYKLAAEIGVGTSTISDWKKNRTKIESFTANLPAGSSQQRFRSKTSKNSALDNVIFKWFRENREKGVAITGPAIQEKAIELNKEINGDASFMASPGWLDRWKRRHGIRGITGDSLSIVDTPAANDFAEEFVKLVESKNISPQQVYNCDETSLNFKTLSGSSLSSQVDSSLGYVKERIFILACSNATGDHKLPLMVIGKSDEQDTYQSSEMDQFPVTYRINKAILMTPELFTEWFYNQFIPAVQNYNETNGLSNQALLVMDRATYHLSEEKLQSDYVDITFLPNNVAHCLQPLDQGVLTNFKQNYTKILCQCLTENLSGSLTENLINISMNDVVHCLAEAWNKIDISELQKSWKKLWPGIYNGDLTDLETIENTTEQLEKVETEYELPELLSSIKNTCLNRGAPSVPSHAEAITALETSLCYIDNHNEATQNDLLVLKRWIGIAASAQLLNPSTSKQ